MYIGIYVQKAQYKEIISAYAKVLVMTMNKNSKSFVKLNKNKKGFSLVELLCAVAIIAIMTPVLVNGFTYAAKLNYRSRMQQRVDEKANFIYEGLASVKYDELADYLSLNNGWYPVNTAGTGYAFMASNIDPDSTETSDWEINVSVQKYSSSYIVPDLNLIGENSRYLTLSDELYVDDAFAKQKISREIRTGEAKIKKYNDKYYEEALLAKVKSALPNSLPYIDENRILITCENLDSEDVQEKIQRKIEITFEKEFENGKFKVVAYYRVLYICNFDSVEYKYTYKNGNKWETYPSPSGFEPLELGGSYLEIVVKSGKIISPAIRPLDDAEPEHVFIYYTARNENDEIELNNNAVQNLNVYFFEQVVDDNSSTGDVSQNETPSDESSDGGAPAKLNYKISKDSFIGNSDETGKEGLQIKNGESSTEVVNLFTNAIEEYGIPTDIYKSSSYEENMYRVSVSVTYKSNFFAQISGNFQAGEEQIIPDT